MSLDDKRQKQLEIIQENIGIFFENPVILNQAFKHPSLSNEQEGQNQDNNQRLEFLGDAVLELVISEYLFKNYKSLREGQMTKIRAFIVCEPTLAKLSQKLHLGNYLMLGKGEENTGGREKNSILADTLEALIGAIYIDKSYSAAYDFIIKNLKMTILKAISGEWNMDYKTNLQEVLQKNDDERISYNLVKELGPDHDKTFYVEAILNNRVLGTGKGKSKKQAEQEAAREALAKINT